MTNNFVSFAGWAVLPNLATSVLQNLFYGITISAGDPKPQPGTPRYSLHRRRIYIFVVSAYLLYTIYEADYNIRLASDFYQDLAVPLTATEREIKSRFRRLAAIHHPDKLSSTSPSSENYFVHLKLAQDTLLNPAKRFAYERFGPEMLRWQRCSSIRDYVVQGIQSILPYYAITAVSMYLLGLLGYLEWGKYWRWIALLVLCVFELHAISRPYFPPFTTKLLNLLLTTFTNHPPYLPFQIIQLARNMSLTFFIACSQIGPLLNPPSASNGINAETALRQQLDRIEQVAKAGDVEATRLIGIEMAPYMGDQQGMNSLKSKVKEWLVQNTIRADPEVRDAMGTLLQKRRPGAPAGARGNR